LHREVSRLLDGLHGEIAGRLDDDRPLPTDPSDNRRPILVIMATTGLAFLPPATRSAPQRLLATALRLSLGRCSKGVDSRLESDSKLVTIDEETNHQIVHRYRFGKANGAPYKPFDPGPQVNMFALDFLRVLLAHLMLRWVDVPLVRAPSIGVKASNTKRFQQGLELQKDGILPSPKDIRQHGPTMVIDGMP